MPVADEIVPCAGGYALPSSTSRTCIFLTVRVRSAMLSLPQSKASWSCCSSSGRSTLVLLSRARREFTFWLSKLSGSLSALLRAPVASLCEVCEPATATQRVFSWPPSTLNFQRRLPPVPLPFSRYPARSSSVTGPHEAEFTMPWSGTTDARRAAYQGFLASLKVSVPVERL